MCIAFVKLVFSIGIKKRIEAIVLMDWVTRFTVTPMPQTKTGGFMKTETQRAINAIRAMESIGCDDLRALFDCMASKMVESKFCEMDLDLIDDMANVICGEPA